MKYPNLFTPMNIGPVTVKNRFVMTAICVGLTHHDDAVKPGRIGNAIHSAFELARALR